MSLTVSTNVVLIIPGCDPSGESVVTSCLFSHFKRSSSSSIIGGSAVISGSVMDRPMYGAQSPSWMKTVQKVTLRWSQHGSFAPLTSLAWTGVTFALFNIFVSSMLSPTTHQRVSRIDSRATAQRRAIPIYSQPTLCSDARLWYEARCASACTVAVVGCSPSWSM